MTALSIVGEELEALARSIDELANRSYRLGPVGFKIRDRILESERRHLTGTQFARRRPSTTRRYQWPIESMADEQQHLSPGRGPLHRLGLLHRVLTTAHHPGQKDDIVNLPGGLDVLFGVKARGPAAYIGMQAQGNGGRIARDPFRFDQPAHQDATGDVLEHMLGDFGART